MKKLIAILTALTMLFGAVCAFAEDDAEDILEELGEELEEELEEAAEELEDAADELEDALEEDEDEDDWGEEAGEDDDEEDDDFGDGTLFGGMTGGWEAPADPTVTAELTAVFDKGIEGLLGVNYVPVVFLGSQVVAGTNYAFLCQATLVVPDAVQEWAIVYLYQDLEGNISVLDITGFDVGLFCDYGSDEDE